MTRRRLCPHQWEVDCAVAQPSWSIAGARAAVADDCGEASESIFLLRNFNKKKLRRNGPARRSAKEKKHSAPRARETAAVRKHGDTEGKAIGGPHSQRTQWPQGTQSSKRNTRIKSSPRCTVPLPLLLVRSKLMLVKEAVAGWLVHRAACIVQQLGECLWEDAAF